MSKPRRTSRLRIVDFYSPADLKIPVSVRLGRLSTMRLRWRDVYEREVRIDKLDSVVDA